MLLDMYSVLWQLFFVLWVVFVGCSSVSFEEIDKRLSEHVQKQ